MTEENTPSPPPEPEDFHIEDFADRPLEDTECHRPIAVWYTEIVGGNITETIMCNECPELQRRLHGFVEGAGAAPLEGTGLCCGVCGTTMEAVRTGHTLGCSHCYEVFADVIMKELMASNRVSMRFSGKKTKPEHIGRAPGETNPLSPSLKLIALNEALQETLSREDYEGAAWLRDQIKQLTEHGDGEQGKQ